jgi:L,D-peptidoglycan transpeptidase YkuD (ErfK/YbiS/YcfS/YnhG family)
MWSTAAALVVATGPAAATLPPSASTRVGSASDAMTAPPPAPGPSLAVGAAASPSADPSPPPSADPVPSSSSAAAPPAAARTSTTPAATLASRLRTLPGATTQVVIVHAPGYSGTHATLETFAKAGGEWRRQFPAMAARIGANGFSDSHTEGDGTTPTGVYAFSATMYGIDANPGVRYTYHRIVADDWWNENPDSPEYNTFQHTPANPGGGSEALWTETVAYRHFAVIRYNIPATGHARGSGIFLHAGTGRSTAGCVSLPLSDLVQVLAWLDPSKSPRIVLSPDTVLSRY